LAYFTLTTIFLYIPTYCILARAPAVLYFQKFGDIAS
jgi:hypothetical protein